jgi:hypothetical protein
MISIASRMQVSQSIIRAYSSPIATPFVTYSEQPAPRQEGPRLVADNLGHFVKIRLWPQRYERIVDAL